jgi:hypothetical protein
MGSLENEDSGPGQPGQKARPYLQNNQSKKGMDSLDLKCLQKAHVLKAHTYRTCIRMFITVSFVTVKN